MIRNTGVKLNGPRYQSKASSQSAGIQSQGGFSVPVVNRPPWARYPTVDAPRPAPAIARMEAAAGLRREPSGLRPDAVRNPGCAALSWRLGDVQQLHFEHQRRLRRNGAGQALVAVGELGRDGEPALAADLHAGHPLVQPLDHVARAESEVERIAAGAAGVELLPVGKPADVMNHDVLAGFGGGAAADDEVFLQKGVAQ